MEDGKMAIWMSCKEGNLLKLNQVIEELKENEEGKEGKEGKAGKEGGCSSSETWNQIFEAVNWINPDNENQTCLHIACQEGHLHVVAYLLTFMQIKINALDIFGWTPIYYACSSGHDEVVRILLSDLRTHKDGRDSQGCSPLHVACESGRSKVVGVLLGNVQVEAKVNEGSSWTEDTPLILACKSGSGETVRVLLDCEQVEVNQQNNEGDTPLHVAVQFQREEVIRLLLGCDRINVNVQNNHGISPLWKSCESGLEKVVKMILASQYGKVIETDVVPKFSDKKASEVAKLSGYEGIGNLLHEYQRNPKEVLWKLRKEFGWASKPAEIFALGSCLQDGLLKIPKEHRTSPIGRFLVIFSQLHIDLQMVLSNISQGIAKNFIVNTDFQIAIEKMISSL